MQHQQAASNRSRGKTRQESFGVKEEDIRAKMKTIYQQHEDLFKRLADC
jgi:hypothetical protein